MRARLSLALGILLTSPVIGADLTVALDVPVLKVAEYHRPYVAVWLEREDQSVAANLAVWYQQKEGKGDGGKVEQGSKWLADLRQWWRRSGRSTSLPIDSVSSATRPAGLHKLEFSDQRAPLAGLPAGSYKLVVEAVREVGGHELLRIPFAWPPSKAAHFDVTGETELGLITLDISP